MKHVLFAACYLLISTAPAFASSNVEPALVIEAATSIAAMTDRRYVFGQNSKRTRVWDALTGELIASAVGVGGAFEPRSEIAILGTEIWDLRNRKRLIESRLSAQNAAASGFTPDGIFAVIGAPKTQVWNLKSRALTGKIVTETDRPSFLALSEMGDFIAIGRDSEFDIYDLAQGRLVKTGALAAVWPFRVKPSKGFSEFVNDRAMEFSVVYEATDRDEGTQQRPLWRIDWEAGNVNIFGDRLPQAGLSARARGTDVVVSWKVEGSTKATLVGHSAPVRRIAFSSDPWTIATGDKSGEVRSWNAHSGELRHRYLGGTDEIVSLSYSPDAQFLLAATRTQIRIYAVTP